MTKLLTLPEAKAKLADRRRHIAPQLDNAAGWQRVTDAVIVGEKERGNGCFGAAVAILAAVGAVVAMFGARSYKTSSGRIIQRRTNGRFRQTTLRDFGITKSELTTGGMICNGCGYGSNEYWRPVLLTGYCPKCGSQDKREAVQS